MAESKYDEGKYDDDDALLDDDELFDDDETIHVSLMIQPDNFPHVLDLPPACTISKLRDEISTDLRINRDAISLQIGQGMEGRILPEFENKVPVTLGSLGYKIGDTATILVFIDTENATDTQTLPKELEVVVWDEYDDGREPTKRAFRVEIEVSKDRKQYFGGYRHKKSGVEYHHAKTQCNKIGKTKAEQQRIREANRPERFHRNTQTFVQSTRSSQTLREQGTQMERPDLIINCDGDKELLPQEYFTSQEQHALKLKSTIIIQRYWRGSKARECAQRIRAALEDRRMAAEEQELKEKEEADRVHEREVNRRMNPKTFADFEILYNELENWRQHETMRIKATDHTPDERREAMKTLLHKETKLLQTIDKLKLSANEENRQQRIEKMLELMATPKKWKLGDGSDAVVHTPFTNRASELLELYKGLKISNLGLDERLDVLLHVKWTVKEFDCNLTRDIVDLIDREADLLNRGRGENSLRGLRKRIENLFLQFIETPEFNPEAARFQKVPRELAARPNVRPIHG